MSLVKSYQRELYRVEQLPVFQNRMYDSREAARQCPKGDVVLVQDLQSGLIHNAAFDPALVVYDENYQNEQALSTAFQDHLGDVCNLLMPYLADRELVEIGCGKGHFLEHLQQRGFSIVGLDPTYEGDNPSIIKEFFGANSSVRGEVIILRHVLEHIQNPVEFLQDVSNANGGQGLIYIEVPCFDWICRHRTWFDVFYEHVNYFRLDDFHRMFGEIKEARRTFGGQYLSVLADLSSLRTPVIDSTSTLTFPADFLESLQRFVRQNQSKSQSSNGAQMPLVVWGGASKGVIFSLFMERVGCPVSTVIDINPAKQNMYLASTGIQVSAPEQALGALPDGTEIVVMNENYLEEIRRSAGSRFHCTTLTALGVSS